MTWRRRLLLWRFAIEDHIGLVMLLVNLLGVPLLYFIAVWTGIIAPGSSSGPPPTECVIGRARWDC